MTVVAEVRPATDATADATGGRGAPAVAEHVPAAPAPRRRRFVLLILSLVFVAVGLVLFCASLLAPQLVDKVTGEAKVAIQTQVQEVVTPGALPEIRLGGEGGVRDLDRCDGTFTEMIGYRVDEVLPLYAAHNFCGGDVILGWELGQRVRVVGTDTVYEVVEERQTPKWSHVEKLRGMAGEFMLQTCFYGENRMRFLALAPVAEEPSAGG
ncbi:hypothetical protein [Microbacterium sp. SSM24]|uniref:hypothetical protein n=1 Tax=Microbacterium sp. SSM24 TaxID=2991714 RepID=UPI002227F3A8|nr:hypothetical protein [Microbacterium sp. SSM24]MCW3493392.1 hypothetical protein [Microbacterium sp. SSM24]